VRSENISIGQVRIVSSAPANNNTIMVSLTGDETTKNVFSILETVMMPFKRGMRSEEEAYKMTTSIDNNST
jgi:hypothetical protein